MLSKNLTRFVQRTAGRRNLSSAAETLKYSSDQDFAAVLKGIAAQDPAAALRCIGAHDSFRAKDLVITMTDSRKPIPAYGEAGYGRKFTDHMLEVDFDGQLGWEAPQIHKFQNLSLHPSAKALHYAIQLFEGMKAYRGIDNKVRLFRPEINMARMKRSAARSALPDFDGEELIKIIAHLVKLDENWISKKPHTCLYLRPTFIGSEGALGPHASANAKLFVIMSPVDVYPYGGRKGIRLIADTQYVRAWPGGVGSFKMGANYAPTMKVAQAAELKNCACVLWLNGEERYVTEAGGMNIMVFWKNKSGDLELVTPTTDSGTILPGVTRQSILELTREWGEFLVTERDFTMDELEEGIEEGRVYEMFGCGTSVVICPFNGLHVVKDNNEYVLDIPTMTSKYEVSERIFKEITDIQYGRKEKSGWTRVVA